MTRLRIAALLVLALAAPVTSAERAGPVGVGEMAPDVSLFDQHGRSFHLAEALETRDFVVLAFYVKAFTGGWELEFSRFRDDAARYAALNAEIVGISMDPPERNLAWTRQLRLPFRLLSDRQPAGAIARRYGVWDDTWNLARRVTFVVDRAGRVRFVEVGGLAIDTSRTLDALTRLARAR